MVPNVSVAIPVVSSVVDVANVRGGELSTGGGLLSEVVSMMISIVPVISVVVPIVSIVIDVAVISTDDDEAVFSGDPMLLTLAVAGFSLAPARRGRWLGSQLPLVEGPGEDHDHERDQEDLEAEEEQRPQAKELHAVVHARAFLTEWVGHVLEEDGVPDP